MPSKKKTAVPLEKNKSLESWIWDAACSIRGAKDAPKYKDYILPLIFAKRLCDVFDDELNRIAAEVGTIMSRVLQPESGMEIYDPTCGSGGILVKCEIEKERGFSNPRKGEKDTGKKTRAPFFNPDGELDKHRRNLPHWQQGEAWMFVTWRLRDSLPKAKLDQWKEERAIWLSLHPKPWDERAEAEYHEQFSRQIDEWLDLGRGSCVLNDPTNAKIVADALRHFDGDRYELASFVVMPNHVHVLFRPLGDHALAAILKSWKGFTAREINKRMGQTGALWQDEYWDRLIRSERHFFKVAEYICENPEKAKLQEGQFILRIRRVPDPSRR